MATIRQDQVTEATIRKQLISGELEKVLLKAAEVARVDIVRVFPAASSSGRDGIDRTGSTRHDNGNAADLQLLNVEGGHEHALDFTNPDELPTIELL